MMPFFFLDSDMFKDLKLCVEFCFTYVTLILLLNGTSHFEKNMTRVLVRELNCNAFTFMFFFFNFI